MAKIVKSLEAAKKYLNEQIGEGSVISMAGEVEAFPSIPTGSFLIDVITGIGGLPQGRVMEFYGPESSGKSTVLSATAAQCQKLLKKPVLYLDYEHAMDKRYLQAQGLNLAEEWFIYSQPDTMEDGMRIAELYMESGLVGLVVMDSVAAMLTSAENDGDIGATNVGGMAIQARVMSQSLKKLVPSASRTGVAVAFINQVRQAIPTGFEASRGIKKETTPGGSALKFYCSLRMKFTKIAGVKGKIYDPVKGVWEDGIVATKVRAEVVKNKMAPPFRKCEFIIRYGVGVDNVMSVVTLAVDRGIFRKTAGFLAVPGAYRHDGEDKNINGLENVCKYFRKESPVGFMKLEQELKALIEEDLIEVMADTYDADISDEEMNKLLEEAGETGV